MKESVRLDIYISNSRKNDISMDYRVDGSGDMGIWYDRILTILRELVRSGWDGY